MKRKSLIDLGLPKALYLMSSFIRLEGLTAANLRDELKAELDRRGVGSWFLDVFDFEILKDYVGRYRTLRQFLDSDEGYDIASGLLKLCLSTDKRASKPIAKVVNSERKRAKREI